MDVYSGSAVVLRLCSLGMGSRAMGSEIKSRRQGSGDLALSPVASASLSFPHPISWRCSYTLVRSRKILENEKNESRKIIGHRQESTQQNAGHPCNFHTLVRAFPTRIPADDIRELTRQFQAAKTHPRPDPATQTQAHIFPCHLSCPA